MTDLYCACCGRPFVRLSSRGPAPSYCSRDCRVQMAARRRAWLAVATPSAQTVSPPGAANASQPSVVWEWERANAGRRVA